MSLYMCIFAIELSLWYRKRTQRSIVMSVFVCVFVFMCLSASRLSGTAAPIFTKILYESLFTEVKNGKSKVAHTRLPSVRFPVLGSQPAGDLSHKPGGRLPLLSARPAVTITILKRTAINFAAWWTEARCVWTVCLRLLPDSVAAGIWIQALLRLSPAR